MEIPKYLEGMMVEMRADSKVGWKVQSSVCLRADCSDVQKAD